jgi:protein SCO1/2
MRRICPAVLAAVVGIAGCHGPRTYTVVGQVQAVDSARREVTISHDAIPGFMSRMTMPFKAREAALLQGTVVPGDLVSATLIVSDTESYLASIVRMGHAPLAEPIRKGSQGSQLQPGGAVPDAQFVDETGAARRFSDWRGKATALTFIYTRCPLPDFCPRMNRHFSAAQAAVLADPAFASRVRFVSVSLDPDYDTPAVLAAHARRAGANPRIWSFLAANRETVDGFAVPFGVYVVRDAANPGVVTHNLRTAVIGSDGRLVTIFSGGEWTPADLVAALRGVADRR